MNKTIDGKQCTIGWLIDNIKISLCDKAVVESIVTLLQPELGKEAPLIVEKHLTLISPAWFGWALRNFFSLSFLDLIAYT